MTATNCPSYDTALIIKITIFQNIMLCGLIKFTKVLQELIASISGIKENARQIAGMKQVGSRVKPVVCMFL
jgi:hypothetical protein